MPTWPENDDVDAGMGMPLGRGAVVVVTGVTAGVVIGVGYTTVVVGVVVVGFTTGVVGVGSTTVTGVTVGVGTTTVGVGTVVVVVVAVVVDPF